MICLDPRLHHHPDHPQISDVKLAVLRETAEGERRVAATPETVEEVHRARRERRGRGRGGAGRLDLRRGIRGGGRRGRAARGGAEGRRRRARRAGSGPGHRSPARSRARWSSPRSIRSGSASGSTPMPRPGSRRWRWSSCRASPAPSRWTSSPRQSNLAGYKAVLDAAAEYGRAFPMMMTAAGTIAAARIFVMGVGVAGLQAIATARRLGAIVSATDVRAATKEQIESLGAKAIFVEKVAGIEGEGAGGYATEMSDEYKAAQAELVSGHIAKQDIVITTALIPGRPAPRLITDAQVASMRPRQRHRRSGGRAGRQCRGRRRRRGGPAPRRQDRRPPQRRRAASPPTPRPCSPATSTISSPPSGTRKRAGGAPRRRRDREGRAADAGRQGGERAAASG